MKTERHWWNGDSSSRGRRDVYIRRDGAQWEVRVQIGGPEGRFRTQECPSEVAAAIVAKAWMGASKWREMALTFVA